MPRPYSEKFLRELQAANPQESLGVKLGLLCIENNLSAAHVAVALDVTRTTMYSWFRGQGIREGKRRHVEAMISVIQKDVKDGRLPVPNSEGSKQYVSEIAGVKI